MPKSRPWPARVRDACKAANLRPIDRSILTVLATYVRYETGDWSLRLADLVADLGWSERAIRGAFRAGEAGRDHAVSSRLQPSLGTLRGVLVEVHRSGTAGPNRQPSIRHDSPSIRHRVPSIRHEVARLRFSRTGYRVFRRGWRIRRYARERCPPLQMDWILMTENDRDRRPKDERTMSDKHDDGGPAFPKPAVDLGTTFECGRNGMSLRDWFAGQALAGTLANPDTGRPEAVRYAGRSENSGGDGLSYG